MLSSQFKKKSKLPTQSKTVLAVVKNRLTLQRENEEKKVAVHENTANSTALEDSISNFSSQCEGIDSGENDHHRRNEANDGFRFSFDIPSESCMENNRSFGFNFDIETELSGNRDMIPKSKKKNKKKNKKKRHQNLNKLNGTRRVDEDQISSPNNPDIQKHLNKDENSTFSRNSLHTPTSSTYESRNQLTSTSNDQSSLNKEQTKIMPPPGFKEIITTNKVDSLSNNENPHLQTNFIPQINHHHDITKINSLSKNDTENIISTAHQTQSPINCQDSFRFNSPVKVKAFINRGSLTVRKDRNKQFGKSIPPCDDEHDHSRKPGCPNAFSFGFDFRNLLDSGATSTTPD